MNLLFIMLTLEMGIILLLPIFGISFIIQFLVGELERKRLQNLQQQKQEVDPIPTQILNKGDMDEN